MMTNNGNRRFKGYVKESRHLRELGRILDEWQDDEDRDTSPYVVINALGPQPLPSEFKRRTLGPKGKKAGIGAIVVMVLAAIVKVILELQ